MVVCIAALGVPRAEEGCAKRHRCERVEPGSRAVHEPEVAAQGQCLTDAGASATAFPLPAEGGCESSPSPSPSPLSCSLYSSSSPSVSPPHMSCALLGSLPIPARIVRPLGSGNNGQVFLALRGRCACCGDARGAGSLRPSRPPAEGQVDGADGDGCQQFCSSGTADDCGDAVDAMPSEFMALKVVRSSSQHARREICCLEHFDACRWDPTVASGEAPSAGGKEVQGAPRAVSPGVCSGAPRLPTRSACPAPPSPELFFAKQVEGHVVIGLELLGPDLFDFTNRFVLYEEELCLLGVELLRTLSALHRRGLVHRSVKPENFCWNAGDLGRCDGHDGDGELVCRSGDGSAGSAKHGLVFMFKMIDFGRSTVGSHDSQLSLPYERPYRGWWHSVRGFLGKPMGQKDDLMGVAHTIGYLLDDYADYYNETEATSLSHSGGVSRSPSGSGGSGTCCSSPTSGSGTTAGGSSTLVGSSSQGSDMPRDHSVECGPRCCAASAGRGALRFPKRRRRSYSSWRRRFADKIECAYVAAARRHKRLHGGRAGEAEDVVARRERRNQRRAWIVRHVEEEFLPRLLPDKYFPPTMPLWWVEWYRLCCCCWADSGVSAEEMTLAMQSGLWERFRCSGKTPGEVRMRLLSLYRESSKSPGARQGWRTEGS
ncbi:hypothetical protein ERJ75_000329600 [Trypanosoma vivax]|uniref:Protein kinase domain-containing protein n=1 Tax=Trypanosoma vivax (strain Y486) TaxID=1055687 RepID=G0UAG8_TRYVY|nr:hypothetical protein TRVL_07916 [Trypanosoma vivax]KAH8617889.1 hypothetical protein ERJ75_000328800 [Trypanosoma vivax]KAH8617923.1 hypothetical protein ERJ75_000329600 [Trypanosoma vivax]CCC52801.1 conserved hypothetical protein [Trypanosoma vivax Y486]